jgi:hypothetical protein
MSETPSEPTTGPAPLDAAPEAEASVQASAQIEAASAALFQPFAHACRLDYPAFHHSGNRMQASIRYIVLHATEGATAQGAASWFVNPASGGSANLVVDDDICFRCLNDFVIPWGAPPLNTNGIHIEQAGFSAWTRTEWLQHEHTIQRAAYKAARRCRAYKIPPRLLATPAELIKDFGGGPIEGGVPVHHGPLEGGVVTHAVISAAYHETDHTDPGDGYPLDVFMKHLARYLGGQV